MTLASWFSSMRHSRRLTRTGARRNARAFNRRESFEALEDRRLLSTANFASDSETVDESAGTFSIPVTVSGTPDGTPTVSTFSSGFSGPYGLAFDAAGNLYVAGGGDRTVSKVPPRAARQHLRHRVRLSRRPGLRLGRQPLRRRRRRRHSEQGDARGRPAAPFVSGLKHPDALAFDAAGNLYVANFGSGTVSEVPPGGVTPPPSPPGSTNPTAWRSTPPATSTSPTRQRHGERGDAGGGRSALSRPGSTRPTAWRSTPPATSTSPTTPTAR